MDDKRREHKRNGLMSTVLAWFSYIIFHYELVTCMLLFEPWERYFINTFFLTAFALISYSSCMFLPDFITLLMTYFGDFITTSYEYVATEL